MKLCTIVIVAALVVAFVGTVGPVGSAYADDNPATTFYWTGDTSTAWNNSANWTGDTVSEPWPNGANDTAIIVDASNDPTLNVTVTIGKLWVATGTLTVPAYTLTLFDDDVPLLIGSGTLEIQKGGKVSVSKGGEVKLDSSSGQIKFVTGAGDWDPIFEIQKPTLITHSGTGGKIVGDVKGRLTSTNSNAVLILGTGITATGTLDIEAPFVNNGLVHAETNTNGGEDHDIITLKGSGKTGDGEYLVSDDALAQIVALVPVSGNADLTMSDGELELWNFFVVCGDLDMTGGAIDLSNDSNSMFEISGCD